MNPHEVKAGLAESAEEFARWLFPNGRKNGHNWLVGSLSGEAGTSLAICIGGSKTGVFKDFATGESGKNLLELFIQARQVPFMGAVRACAEWLGGRRAITCGISTPPSAVSRFDNSGLARPMSDLDIARAQAMAKTASDNPLLLEPIARERNWQVETLINLANDSCLGWHAGSLAFIYESGVKLRSFKDGKRVFRWAFGKPWLWRGFYLWGRSTIYLCEGETDCISLIDAGVEEDGRSRAIALPSATTFRPEWAQLFRGKDVILALDGDKAGQEATATISGHLQPVVNKLRQINWGGLQDAA